MPAPEAMERVREASRKAILLDPRTPEAHAALASVAALYDWDWDSATKHFQDALSASTNPLARPLVRSWYALCLAGLGLAQQAQEEIERARADFPSSFLIPALAGRIAYLAHDPGAAIRKCDESIALEEHFFLSYLFKGHALRFLRRNKEALECFVRACELTGGNPVCLAEVAHVQALMGERQKSLETLRKLHDIASAQYVSPHVFALVQIGLGENEKALKYLEETLQERGAYLIFLTTDAVYDSLRREPEFSKLVATVGFVR